MKRATRCFTTKERQRTSNQAIVSGFWFESNSEHWIECIDIFLWTCWSSSNKLWTISSDFWCRSHSRNKQVSMVLLLWFIGSLLSNQRQSAYAGQQWRTVKAWKEQFEVRLAGLLFYQLISNSLWNRLLLVHFLSVSLGVKIIAISAFAFSFHSVFLLCRRQKHTTRGVAWLDCIHQVKMVLKRNSEEKKLFSTISRVNWFFILTFESELFELKSRLCERAISLHKH